MIDLLSAVLDVLSSGLGWRGILCLIVSIIVACILGHYSVAILWKFDVPVLVVVLGVGLGIYWDQFAE